MGKSILQCHSVILSFWIGFLGKFVLSGNHPIFPWNMGPFPWETNPWILRGPMWWEGRSALLRSVQGLLLPRLFRWRLRISRRKGGMWYACLLQVGDALRYWLTLINVDYIMMIIYMVYNGITFNIWVYNI